MKCPKCKEEMVWDERNRRWKCLYDGTEIK